jgi:hypothetical protein
MAPPVMLQLPFQMAPELGAAIGRGRYHGFTGIAALAMAQCAPVPLRGTVCRLAVVAASCGAHLIAGADAPVAGIGVCAEALARTATTSEGNQFDFDFSWFYCPSEKILWSTRTTCFLFSRTKAELKAPSFY